MDIKSIKIFELFLKFKDKNFIFVRQNGNFGDELIWRGAEKLAKLADLSYKTVSSVDFINKTFPPDHVLYFHGNGNFNSIWDESQVKAFKIAVLSHTGVIILGPTTFMLDKVASDAFSEQLLMAKSSNIFIFCREQFSYDRIHNYIPKKIYFEIDHDTALNLQREDITNNSIKNKINKTFYAIRNDAESTHHMRFNILSFWGDPVSNSSTFEEWLELHDSVEEIVTNRLHSSIVGTILKKNVCLLPNSYFKNRGIWEYSLRDMNVKWLDQLEYGPFTKDLMRFSYFRALANSYKLTTFVFRLYLKKIRKT